MRALQIAVIAACMFPFVGFADDAPKWTTPSVSPAPSENDAVVGCVSFSVEVAKDAYNPIHIKCHFRLPTVSEAGSSKEIDFGEGVGKAR